MALNSISSGIVPGGLPNNVYASALLNDGWRWTTPVIHYSFGSSTGTFQHRLALLEQAQFTFASWSSVANISFQYVSNPADAEIVLHVTTSAHLNGSGGRSGSPNNAVAETIFGNTVIGDVGRVHAYVAAEVFVTKNNGQGPFDLKNNERVSFDAGGSQLVLHEIGHALGLKHPHDDGVADNPVLFPGVDGLDANGNSVNITRDFGDHDLNQTLYTVMSYNEAAFGGRSAVVGPAAFDIAAIQHLYGARTNARSGDDIYRLPDADRSPPWNGALWDTGGTDIVVYDGSSRAVIDLRPATLDNSATGGGMASYTLAPGNLLVVGRGFTIAGDLTNAIADRDGVTGVIIENARGGSGNDDITGNDTDNDLRGMDGHDTLRGLGGRDKIDGGRGADLMEGGAGGDIYYVDNVGDRVSETTLRGVLGSSLRSDSGGVDTIVTTLDTYRLPNSVTSVVENLIGSNTSTRSFVGIGNFADNRITGGGGRDYLAGGAGHDILNGVGGADTLVGGADHDRYYATAADTVIEDAGGGQDTVLTASARYTLAANVENLQYVGTGAGVTRPYRHAFIGTGNNLDNVLSGGRGRDLLYGLRGNDTFLGGGSTDTLVGGWGNDTYIVEAGDRVVENAGRVQIGDRMLRLGGTDTVETALDAYTLPDHVENLTYRSNRDFVGTGNAQRNTITGGGANDTLSGFGDADTLQGEFGNDVLIGGLGADRLDGGAGDDVLVIDGEDMSVVGGEGYDRAYLIESADEGMRFALAGTGVEYVQGSRGADTLDASGNTGQGTIKLYGGVGDDTFVTGSTEDWIFGGQGDDTATFSGTQASYVVKEALDWPGWTLLVDRATGAQYWLQSIEHLQFADITVDAPDRREEIVGAQRYNELTAGDGGTELYGNVGNDVLTGGAGNDILDGGGRGDELRGRGGNDLLIIDAADAVIDGGEGFDTVQFRDHAEGSGFTFTMGGTNVESVLAGLGNDTIDARGVSTHAQLVIYTERGDDTVYASESLAYIYGGDGSDTVVFAGKQSDYAASASSYGTILVKNVATGAQTELDAIETVRFSDAVIGTNGWLVA